MSVSARTCLSLMALAIPFASGPVAGDDVPAVDEPLTVQHVLANPSDEPVRLVATVEGWVEYQGFSAGERESQTCILTENRAEQERLDVLISPEVFDRLAALGIEDPKAHFVQKSVTFIGVVHRNPAPFDSISNILWVENLDQIESITPVDSDE